jgi:hypothetical protein
MPDWLGFLVDLAALAGIGFGPALWFLAPGPGRVVQALGLAPALGMVFIGLVEPLAVIYLGPVQVWAVPLTLVLLVASAAAVVVHWRRNPAEYQALPSWRQSAPVAATLLLSLGLLLAPVIRDGIQYTIFRSNSSDALVYMSLAESLRTVNWQTLCTALA